MAMGREDMVKVGVYAFAKRLCNGEWRLYLGRWSQRKTKIGYVTGLEVCRDAGGPIRFESLEQIKEYVSSKAL